MNFKDRMYNWLNRIQPSDTFCALPWMHVFVNNKGQFYPCCMAEHHGEPATDSSGQTLQFEKLKDVSDVINSPQMLEIRQKMLMGEFPKACSRCANEERHGIRSYRQYRNAQYANWILRNWIQVRKAHIKKPSIQFLDLRLGNLCNLKCRMCNPIASRPWIEDWHKLFPGSLTENDRLELKNLDWFKNGRLREIFEGILPSLRHLHVAGGEPLLIPEFADLLNLCIQKKYAHQIALTYNTNLTVLPEAHLQAWKSFRSVRLMVSLDGTGEINDLIRYPSRFNTVDRHIRYLCENTKRFMIKSIEINVTIQILNLFGIPDLLIYLDSLPFDGVHAIKFNILTDPKYYNIQCLPAHLKLNAQTQLKAVLPRLSSAFVQKHSIAAEIERLISFMNTIDGSPKFAKFKRITKALDEIRRQDTIRVVPQLWEAIGPENGERNHAQP